jgi:hypothetical protein
MSLVVAPVIVGRHATVQCTRPVLSENYLPRYIEHGHFDELAVGLQSTLVERNSVVLIPNLLSPEECSMLVADVEKSHASSVTETGNEDQPDTGTERYMIGELSESTRQLFEIVLRERLLPFVSKHLSGVEENIWALSGVERPSEEVGDAGDAGDARDAREGGEDGTGAAFCPLARQKFVFSSQEPAINRYAAGGDFEAHRDKLALTLNVLLSESFDGGGTIFWNEVPAAAAAKESKIVLLPRAGVGVVFNGTVLHAGRVVTSGLRHLLVASFSVDSKWTMR